jgi:hypothetical protein
MWPSALMPLIAVLIAGLAAWRHATRFDRQTGREGWPRESDPGGALRLALASLVTAVAAAMILQMMWLPRIVQ